jgi:hypothetical protein
MNAGIPAILNMQVEKVAVPVGDRAEQLIANLTLSIIAAQLKARATASEYLVEAHSLAADLSNETLTYRPLQPSKFAYFTFDMDGKVGALVFPIVNDSLVIPSIRFDVKGGGAGIPHTANLTGFDVLRCMLRIRTRKTVAVLKEIKNAASLEELVDRTTKFLAESLYNEKPYADPLDRANDCLAVARDLLKRDFPLASIALANVDVALDSFVKMPSMTNYLAVAQGMRDRVKQLMSELRQSSS